jgi:hypothetical protein
MTGFFEDAVGHESVLTALKASDEKRKTVGDVKSWRPEKVEERPDWGVSSDKALGKRRRRNAPPHVLRVRQAGRGDFG